MAEGDRIDLRRIGLDSSLLGNQSFTWIGGADFGEVVGELRFASGVLEGDLDGDGGADFQVTLTGIATLTAANIWLWDKALHDLVCRLNICPGGAEGVGANARSPLAWANGHDLLFGSVLMDVGTAFGSWRTRVV